RDAPVVVIGAGLGGLACTYRLHRHGSRPAPQTPVLTVYNGGKEGASYPTDVAHGPAPPGVVGELLSPPGGGGRVRDSGPASTPTSGVSWGFARDRSISLASTRRPSARGT